MTVACSWHFQRLARWGRFAKLIPSPFTSAVSDHSCRTSCRSALADRWQGPCTCVKLGPELSELFRFKATHCRSNRCFCQEGAGGGRGGQRGLSDATLRCVRTWMWRKDETRIVPVFRDASCSSNWRAPHEVLGDAAFVLSCKVNVLICT